MNYVIIIFQSCKSVTVYILAVQSSIGYSPATVPTQKSKQHYSRKHYQPSKQISLSELTLFLFAVVMFTRLPLTIQLFVCLFYENLYTKTLFFSNRNPTGNSGYCYLLLNQLHNYQNLLIVSICFSHQCCNICILIRQDCLQYLGQFCIHILCGAGLFQSQTVRRSCVKSKTGTS